MPSGRRVTFKCIQFKTNSTLPKSPICNLWKLVHSLVIGNARLWKSPCLRNHQKLFYSFKLTSQGGCIDYTQTDHQVLNKKRRVRARTSYRIRMHHSYSDTSQKTTFWPIQRFLKLTLATKRITPCEREWKTVCQKFVSFLEYHFVWGHLCVLQDV